MNELSNCLELMKTQLSTEECREIIVSNADRINDLYTDQLIDLLLNIKDPEDIQLFYVWIESAKLIIDENEGFVNTRRWLKEISNQEYSEQQLREMEELDLNHLLIVNIPPMIFNGMSNLKKLDLSENSLGNYGINGYSFYGIDNLRVLNLESNNIQELEEFIFTNLHNLRKLYLGGNGMTKIYPNAFIGLDHLGELDLSDNNITQYEYRTFSREKLPNLYTLNLILNPNQQPNDVPPEVDIQRDENVLHRYLLRRVAHSINDDVNDDDFNEDASTIMVSEDEYDIPQQAQVQENIQDIREYRNLNDDIDLIEEQQRHQRQLRGEHTQDELEQLQQQQVQFEIENQLDEQQNLAGAVPKCNRDNTVETFYSSNATFDENKEFPQWCDTDIDIISQLPWNELTPNEIISIQYPDDRGVYPPNKITCYVRDDLIEFMEKADSIMFNWIQNPHASAKYNPMNDMGIGGMPGNKCYRKEPYYNRFITSKSYEYINNNPDIKTYKAISLGFIRLGNWRGSPGVSEMHGQLPGSRVYKLVPLNVN